MMIKEDKKLMVIGIDGVPYELLKDFAGKGIMPYTQKLIERHGLVKTRSPFPEISSVSWTSFMTGLNPGEHNTYGFVELNRDKYAYTFPSFGTLPVKPLWEEMQSRNKSSIIINLPCTYPAKPLNGVLISGFVALDLEKAVYPKSLLPFLKKINYQVDVDTTSGKSEKKLFLDDLNKILKIRYNVYKKLEYSEKWDLFLFVITGTDRLHHYLFDVIDSPGSPYYNDFLDYYREVDWMIGEITSQMERTGIPFVMLSDHGFVRIKKEVYISQYLKEWGYLDLEEKNPKNIKSMTEKTIIFALDPSRLYIHLKGKYKRGCVKNADYEKLRAEIKEKFLALDIDGEKVIKDVFYKEDIYKGKYLNNAPDLVLHSQYGFDLKSGVTKNKTHGKSFFQGMHSQDNAFLIDSFGYKLNHFPWIFEIGRKIKENFLL